MSLEKTIGTIALALGLSVGTDQTAYGLRPDQIVYGLLRDAERSGTSQKRTNDSLAQETRRSVYVGFQQFEVPQLEDTYFNLYTSERWTEVVNREGQKKRIKRLCVDIYRINPSLESELLFSAERSIPIENDIPTEDYSITIKLPQFVRFGYGYNEGYDYLAQLFTSVPVNVKMEKLFERGNKLGKG